MQGDENSGKLKIVLIIFGWLWSKMDMGLYFLNKWMKLAYFLHVNTYTGMLKVALIVFGWAWSNIGLVFKVMGLYNLLYLKNECMK